MIMRNSRPGRWISLATLAGVSLALVMASLAAPNRVGAVLVAPGLTGLFALRLIALHRGWPLRLRNGILT